ncbi:MAG: spore protease YyaC [Roseburia sp.]|nr:spore protease YyaC [Roseburia sp.]
MEFSFNVYNSLAAGGEVLALKRILPEVSGAPVIVCIGSDLSVGDSLGPVTGTKLKEKLSGYNVYVYGTLSRPITAHEVKYTNQFIKNTHPESTVIAIDAAVGAAGDIGLIKVAKRGIKPGSGANKRLSKVGDVSVMGIVAEKSLFNYSLFSSTRLNIVYKMAEIISEGVSTFIIEAIQNSQLAKNAKQTLSNVNA